VAECGDPSESYQHHHHTQKKRPVKNVSINNLNIMGIDISGVV
jgi:hypothetical protein